MEVAKDVRPAAVSSWYVRPDQGRRGLLLDAGGERADGEVADSDDEAGRRRRATDVGVEPAMTDDDEELKRFTEATCAVNIEADDDASAPVRVEDVQQGGAKTWRAGG